MVFSGSLLVRALIVAFVVGVLCVFLGGVIAPMLKAPPVTAVGAFAAALAWAFAVAAGLWYYFARS